MDLVFLMDPLGSLSTATDSSVALMQAALAAGHRVRHCCPADVSRLPSGTWATARPVTGAVGMGGMWQPYLRDAAPIDLGEVDAVLIRTDPPFDAGYLRLTWLLDGLSDRTLIVNSPGGLRTANEKLWALQFTDVIPATAVSADTSLLLDFVADHGEAVLKPVDGFAGRGVVAVTAKDRSTRGVIEALTDGGRRQVVAQEFLADVYSGDKRIILVGGEPIGAVNRIPPSDDFRANLGVGGQAAPAEIDSDDRRIIERIGPELRRLGLWFVGIDVIGRKLTEVNVTSPTGLRQLAALTGSDPAARVIERLAAAVAAHR